MPGKFTVILNHGSGDRDGDGREKRIRAAFDRHGIAVDVIAITPRSGISNAVRLARAGQPDVVVVAGGDGTISGVAAELSGSGQTMAIIPSGTFNYFARSLDLPEDVNAAVDTIATGVPRATAVAMINDRLFLNNASIGAYSAILQTREGLYSRWGRSRITAYWSVLKTLATFRAPLKLTITIDGTQSHYRTPLIFAMNNAFQLEQMGLPGRDCIEAGQMVLLVAPPATRWGLFKHAFALGLGLAKHKTDYEMHCAAAIEIQIKRKRRAVARDGEISKMSGPFQLRVLPDALNIIVPAAMRERVR